MPTTRFKSQNDSDAFVILKNLLTSALRLMVRGILILLIAGIAAAQDDSESAPSEYDVKAAFVYKLATFVHWPEPLFDSPDHPLIFGILGDDPFGATFDSIIVNKSIGSHPLTVVRTKSLDKLKYCHVLFVCASEHKHVNQILNDLTSFRTLTVCDFNRYTAAGFMVYLNETDGKVRLAIDNERVINAGLKINSRVLKLADVISEESKP